MGIGTCIIAKPWSRVTKLQKKDISITQNGSIEILPDSGYNGLSSVNISSIVPTFVKTTSFDTLPTDNVVNGTIGLIQEEENVFEPFTPGIEANALLFDTSFNLFNIIRAVNSGKFFFVSNSGKESEIFKNNNLYLPSNSLSFIIVELAIYIIVNKSNNYYLLNNISSLPSDEIFLKEGVIKIFKADSSNFSWINNYVEFNSVILDTFYIFDFGDLSLTSESIDNYLGLNKWVKCLTNNIENKISQVYEYNGSWENVSKDIILQEKSEFVNSLTPSRIEVIPDEGADALSKVTVDLSSLELQSKTVNITQNGQTTITPDEGKIGLDEVIVNTSVVNGGENLLFYNNYETGNSFWSGVHDEVVLINGDVIRAEASKTNPWSCLQNKSVSTSNNFNFDTTKKYTISFQIMSNDGLTRYVGIRNPGADDIVMDWLEITTRTYFVRKTITFTPLKSSCGNGLVFLVCNPTGEINDDWIEVKDVKIEEGSIATPFSKSINDEYGWGSTLEKYIDDANGWYMKTSLLTDYQNTYNSFKDLTTIPQFSSNGNHYKFIPHLPLPSNTKNLFMYWYDIIEVPSFLRFDKITDVSNFFAGCYSLRDFKYSAGFNATNSIAGLFQQCANLSGDISINAPKATSANSAFYLCKNINSITLTTAPLTIYGQLFLNATNLQSVYNLNLGETSEAQYQPFYCSNLTNITFADGSIINNSTSFSSCTKLTVDSILNILNILKDLTGSTSATLTLGAENLAKLTDEQKAIATNKNWVLA